MSNQRITVSWPVLPYPGHIRAIRPIRNVLGCGLKAGAGWAELGRCDTDDEDTALALALELESVGIKPELSFSGSAK